MSVTFKSNLDEVIDALGSQLASALEECGMDAEYYAKRKISEVGAVDTGRLRNSITHATSKYSGQSTYSTNKKSKTGKKIKQTSYSDGAAKEVPDEYTMAVGTNVEYARIIEDGTHSRAGRPYIKPAITEHKDHYLKVIKRHLKG